MHDEGKPLGIKIRWGILIVGAIIAFIFTPSFFAATWTLSYFFIITWLENSHTSSRSILRYIPEILFGWATIIFLVTGWYKVPRAIIWLGAPVVILATCFFGRMLYLFVRGLCGNKSVKVKKVSVETSSAGETDKKVEQVTSDDDQSCPLYTMIKLCSPMQMPFYSIQIAMWYYERKDMPQVIKYASLTIEMIDSLESSDLMGPYTWLSRHPNIYAQASKRICGGYYKDDVEYRNYIKRYQQGMPEEMNRMSRMVALKRKAKWGSAGI